MRLAPLDELATASDTLIMDGQRHGGPATADLEAFIGGQAVVFVFRSLGVHALRIDASGSFGPL